MVIGIYNPYRKTLGGGEQYLFSFASYFLQNKQTVIYFSEDKNVVQQVEERFGISLKKMNVQPPVFEHGNIIQKFLATRQLDILLFYSDGSIPVAFAKKNYLIFQFPVPWVSAASWKNKMKLSRINGIIVNSQFTKRFIDKTFSINSLVITPAIQLNDYTIAQKEKLILSVGRFTKGMNTKKQDILIDAFKKFVDGGASGWTFVLAGGVLDQDLDEIERLKKKTQGYPITIEPNIEKQRLRSLYAKSFCFWHAAGFGVDEEKNPEQVEHFGITTLEAMASGSVPIVYPAGGQKEIIEDGKSGFYWRSIEELLQKTQVLIDKKKEYSVIQNAIIERVQLFNDQSFYQHTKEIFPLPIQ